jgi:hypothetical protein
MNTLTSGMVNLTSQLWYKTIISRLSITAVKTIISKCAGIVAIGRLRVSFLSRLDDEENCKVFAFLTSSPGLNIAVQDQNMQMWNPVALNHVTPSVSSTALNVAVQRTFRRGSRTQASYAPHFLSSALKIAVQRTFRPHRLSLISSLSR